MKKLLSGILASTLILSSVTMSYATAETNIPEGTAYTETLSSVVLSSEYTSVSSFSEGFAIVTNAQGDKGVINGKGEEVIAPNSRYKYLTSFTDGIAVFGTVDINDMDNFDWESDESHYMGYLTTAGQEIYVQDFDGHLWFIPHEFHNGYGVASYTEFFYDEDGRFTGAGDRSVLVDTRGNVTELGYFARSQRVDDQGLIAVDYWEGDTEIAFMDVNQNIVLETKYFGISNKGFCDGLCAVSVMDENGDAKWGYIDVNGKEVIPCTQDRFWDFSDNYCVYPAENGLYGYKDTSGQVVIPATYAYAYGFSNGRAWVKAEGADGYHLINKEGKFVTSELYQAFSTSFADDFAKAGTGYWEDGVFYGKFGLISYSGAMESQIMYDDISYIGTHHKVLVKEGTTYTLWNLSDFYGSEDTTPTTPTITPTTGASTWAVPYIQEAYDLGLLNGLESIWGNYENNITREQFCVLMMNVYQSAGKAMPTGENPFTDITSPEVVAAFQLGIVSGTTATTFSPNNSIKRQELAVMVKRTAELFETVDNLSTTTPFLDDSSIDVWAKEAVFYAQREGFLTGSSGNILPHDNLNNQEAVTVALRLAQKFA